MQEYGGYVFLGLFGLLSFVFLYGIWVEKPTVSMNIKKVVGFLLLTEPKN